MYNVVFDPLAYIWIDRYIVEYTRYYENLYSDTGIWSEDEIIDSYCREGYARYDEIVDTITHTLENDIISYMKNETLLRWRTRVIIVKFSDEWSQRVVTDIEIR